MPAIPSLVELLASVPALDGTEQDGAFRARPIPGTQHLVGRNGTGQPTVLLSSSTARLRAPIRLAAVEVLFSVRCRVDLVGAPQREETLTVLTCVAKDAKVQAYFLHVCETIVRIVGACPTHDGLAEAVTQLVDLFERLSRPPTRSTLGLLGELYVIARSRDPRLAARAWRSGEDDRFDFAAGDVRLEVKASGARSRTHHFSLEQCQPPPGTIGILASVFIEIIGGGTSMQELLLNLGDRLGDDELLLKVQGNVAATLGEALSEALSLRFDERLAASSLCFFDLATIPAVRGPLPAEVSDVRFRANLAMLSPIAIDEFTRRNSLAGSLLPTR